jgi:hypothetical protein
MMDFLLQHKKLILISGLIVIILAGSIFYVLLKNQTNSTIDTSTEQNQQIVANQLDYSFLKDNLISKEDQHLLLSAKILTEQFGTYSTYDLRGLVDVKNYATSSYQLTIQDLIDSIAQSTKNSIRGDLVSVSTLANPNSAKIIKKSNRSAEITIEAVYAEELKPEKNIISKVIFSKEGNFWLVDDIEFIDQ